MKVATVNGYDENGNEVRKAKPVGDGNNAASAGFFDTYIYADW